MGVKAVVRKRKQWGRDQDIKACMYAVVSVGWLGCDRQ